MVTSPTFELLLQNLEENPSDRTLLGIIADCADELEFGSGDGWRAIQKLDRKPWFWSGSGTRGWIIATYPYINSWGYYCWLPTDWFELLKGDMGRLQETKAWEATEHTGFIKPYTEAALAFNRLPLNGNLSF